MLTNEEQRELTEYKQQLETEAKDKCDLSIQTISSEIDKTLGENKELIKKQALQTLKSVYTENKTLTEWKDKFKNTWPVNEEAYLEMNSYIEMVVQDLSHLAIIEGAGGLAKTYTAHRILQSKVGTEYAYYNCFTSPVGFYNFLYDNRDDKIILIDDTEGIWYNQAIISILKNACEINGPRMISWNSTTSRLEGRSNKKLFTSRIIMLTNKLPDIDKHPHIQALITRANHTKLEFSYKQKIAIIKEINEQPQKGLTLGDRRTIFEFIERNTDESTKELSIRTLFKVYAFYKYSESLWETLALGLLEKDGLKELVLKLSKTINKVLVQQQVYTEKTGRSRADFFRVRRRLRNEEILK